MTRIFEQQNDKIVQIPQWFFFLNNFNNYEEVNVTFQSLIKLEQNDLAVFSYLKKLVLIANNLHEIHAKSFNCLKHLETLNLQLPSLITVPDKLLYKLLVLKDLQLLLTKAEYISKYFFKRNRQIRYLKIDTSWNINLAFLLKLKQIERLDWRTSANNRCISTLYPAKRISQHLKVLKYNFSRLKHLQVAYSPPNLVRLHISFSVFQADTLGNILSTPRLRTLCLSNIRGLKTFDFAMQNTRSPIALIYLNLSMNVITRIVPNAFTRFAKLEILNFFMNRIAFVSSESFRGLDNLVVLNLSYNMIQIIDPNAFEGLKKLQLLFLGYNLITDFYSIINNGTNMRKICVNSNSISVLLFFGSCTTAAYNRLELLDLNNNSIRSVDSRFFGLFRALKTLYLQNNLIGFVRPEMLSSLTGLTHLNLSGNSICELDANTFVNLKSLETLKIARNSIGSIPDDLFRNTISLKLLDLSFNKITSLPDHTFRSNPNLHYLRLNNNLLRSFSLNPIYYIRLQSISLHANPLRKIHIDDYYLMHNLSFCSLIIDSHIQRLLIKQQMITKFKTIVSNN